MKVLFSVWTRTVSGLNARERWSARARRVRRERLAVLAAFPAHWRKALKQHPNWGMRVELTRCGRKLDSDNLQGALKGVRDELAKQLGLDDGSPRFEWVYRQDSGHGLSDVVLVSLEVRESLAGVAP